MDPYGGVAVRRPRAHGDEKRAADEALAGPCVAAHTRWVPPAASVCLPPLLWRPPTKSPPTEKLYSTGLQSLPVRSKQFDPAPRGSTARRWCPTGNSRLFLTLPARNGRGRLRTALAGEIDVRNLGIEQGFKLRVGSVEIVGNPNLAAIHAHRPRPAAGCDRDEFRHRDTGARNRDLLACRDPLQQPRKLGLRLVNVDFHSLRLAKQVD